MNIFTPLQISAKATKSSTSQADTVGAPAIVAAATSEVVVLGQSTPAPKPTRRSRRSAAAGVLTQVCYQSDIASCFPCRSIWDVSVLD